MKVRELITLALKDSGVFGLGQTPTGTDINDALTRCNMMLAQWQKKRWLIWHLVDKSVVSTGAQTYSIGPSGNINLPYRPDKIEFCFFRLVTTAPPNQVDYVVELLQSREDYSRIGMKQLATFPQYLFYDAAYPLGLLYPWPVPQAALYELHVLVKETLLQFASLDTVIVLPEEYYNAIYYNLIIRLWEAYRMPLRPGTVALAKDALNVIRKANFQIGRLQVDTSLIRPGIYNVYSDIVR